MTPAQILPELTADELDDFAYWLRNLSPSSCVRVSIWCRVNKVSDFLRELADLRRKG